MTEPEMSASPPWRHETVNANGLRVHYVTAGKGPLVVLLHGFPQFWYAWRHQIPALASRFRVVAPDLRGYGETERPRRVRDYRMENLTGDVAGLVHALGEERAAIVGHDWGGGIAWQTAIDRPEIVSRLGVLNCPHPQTFARALRTNRAQLRRSWYIFFFQIPWLPEAMLRTRRAPRAFFRDMAVRQGTFTDEDLETFGRAMRAPGAARAMLAYYRATFRDTEGRRRMEGETLRVRAPTLVIWGEEDVALGRELTDDLGDTVDAPYRIEYLRASHWVNEECPDDVNRLLLGFLEEGRT